MKMLFCITIPSSSYKRFFKKKKKKPAYVSVGANRHDNFILTYISILDRVNEPAAIDKSFISAITAEKPIPQPTPVTEDKPLPQIITDDESILPPATTATL